MKSIKRLFILAAILTLNADSSIEAQNLLPAEIDKNMVLTSANSPYIALTDVIVKPNVLLTLEPGVEIQSANGTSIYINGQIYANGNEEKLILLHGMSVDSHWGALCFENTTGPSFLSHIKIEGAVGIDTAQFKAAVSMYNANVTLDHISTRNTHQPFYSRKSTIILTHCILDGAGLNDFVVPILNSSVRIEDCHFNGELDFDFVDDCIIRNNKIEIVSNNANRDGIDIGASKNVLIEKNQVFNCPDKGISIGEKSTVTVQGNLVVNTTLAVAVKDSSVVTIDHNTFYNDSIGVACYENIAGWGGGFANVKNTVFSKTRGAEFSLDSKSSIQITYSLSDKNRISGLGNIKDDPHFAEENEFNFYLLSDSPCIDAGDPASHSDPDSTRTDIGAFFFDKGQGDLSHHDRNDPSVRPRCFTVHQNYPNPFNPVTTIVFELPRNSNVTVVILNILGRRVTRLLQEEKQVGVHRIEWRGVDDAGNAVSSGMYFYKVTAGDKTILRKMILMR
jgi:parallel beta-helix repeat protein